MVLDASRHHAPIIAARPPYSTRARCLRRLNRRLMGRIPPAIEQGLEMTCASRTIKGQNNTPKSQTNIAFLKRRLSPF